MLVTFDYGERRELRWWRLGRAPGERLRALPHSVFAAFSPDGRSLVATSLTEAHRIDLTTAHEDKLAGTWAIVAAGPDGTTVLAAGDPDKPHAMTTWSVDGRTTALNAVGVTGAWSARGYAVVRTNREVIASGHRFAIPDGPLAVTPDGRWIASGGVDAPVSVIDTDGWMAREQPSTRSPFAVFGDGAVAAMDEHGGLVVAGRAIAVPARPQRIVVAPDDERVVAIGDDWLVVVARTNGAVRRFRRPRGRADAVAFLRGGDTLIEARSGDESDQVRLTELATGESRDVSLAYGERVLALHAAGDRVVVAATDYLVSIDDGLPRDSARLATLLAGLPYVLDDDGQLAVRAP
jgi:hypothetical protein